MKVKLSDILNAKEALKLVEGRELPTKLSYWLSRLQVKIEKPLKAYEDSRMDLFKKFGDLDSEGTRYTVPPEKLDDFQKEILSLIEIEEEITFEPIKIEHFEGKEFTKEFFILIDKFVTE